MDPLSILIFIVLFGLSAFFSGSEIAFMSLPKHKVAALVKQKKFGAKTLQKIKTNNEKLLITILIGNNLVNVLTASFATKISLEIAQASGVEQSLAIGISTGVITLLLLLFGEIFPKTIATKYSEKISLSIAKIYKILLYIFWPIATSIEWLMKKMHKGDSTIKITDEEIEAFIDMGKDAGLFEPGEHEKLKRMLDFYETDTEDIITPRVKIEALQKSSTVQEALEQIKTFSHSRLPVYEVSIDDADQVVSIKELTLAHLDGKGEHKLCQLNLAKAVTVPLTTPIYKTLEKFRKSHKHLALVIDEYGGVAGLVTVEDIIEQVFGDFKDETDREADPIKVVNHSKFVLQADIRINDILDLIQVEFDDIELSEAEFGGETVGYTLMSKLGRFPQKNEKIIFKLKNEAHKIKKLEFTIKTIVKKRIQEIELNLT